MASKWQCKHKYFVSVLYNERSSINDVTVLRERRGQGFCDGIRGFVIKSFTRREGVSWIVKKSRDNIYRRPLKVMCGGEGGQNIPKYFVTIIDPSPPPPITKWSLPCNACGSKLRIKNVLATTVMTKSQRRIFLFWINISEVEKNDFSCRMKICTSYRMSFLFWIMFHLLLTSIYERGTREISTEKTNSRGIRRLSLDPDQTIWTPLPHPTPPHPHVTSKVRGTNLYKLKLVFGRDFVALTQFLSFSPAVFTCFWGRNVKLKQKAEFDLIVAIYRVAVLSFLNSSVASNGGQF